MKITLKSYLQKKYSTRSLISYENIIKRYLLTLGERAEKATYSDVLDYIGQLRAQGLHPKSLRNHLFTIKIYYHYLIATKQRNDHPCPYLYLKDRINRQVHIESLYSKEQITTFYKNYQTKDASPKNKKHHQRNKIILSLLIYQALTVSEITHLKTSHIDLEKGTIQVPESNKNKGRTLNLQPGQIMLLYRYLQEVRQHYSSKQNPNKQTIDYLILNQQGNQLGTGSIRLIINLNQGKENRLTPLKIRQSVIANLLKENNDLRIVQEFAGHRRAASTEAYKQSGLEALRSAIERFHPHQQ